MRRTPLLSSHPVAETAADAAVALGLVGGVVAAAARALALSPAPSTCRVAGRMLCLQVRRGSRTGGFEKIGSTLVRAGGVGVRSLTTHTLPSLQPAPPGPTAPTVTTRCRTRWQPSMQPPATRRAEPHWRGGGRPRAARRPRAGRSNCSRLPGGVASKVSYGERRQQTHAVFLLLGRRGRGGGRRRVGRVRRRAPAAPPPAHFCFFSSSLFHCYSRWDALCTTSECVGGGWRAQTRCRKIGVGREERGG